MPEYDNRNTFTLFVNDKKGNEKAPDRSGTLNVDGVEYYIDGWIRKGKSGHSSPARLSRSAPERRMTTMALPSETRTLDQNARLWAYLGEVSRQVEWHGQKLLDTEWKDVFTAALKRQKVVPGLDGGFVVLGTSTRKMTKQEMTELMELIAAFGAGA